MPGASIALLGDRDQPRPLGAAPLSAPPHLRHPPRHEAAWNKDGAFCLSHQRWLDFDPEGECKLKLIRDQTVGKAFNLSGDSQLNVPKP